jgi:YfiH family protein
MLVDVIRLAPADCVQIAVTTRFDGHISGRFGFNLATHVNDQPEAVAANREVLVEFLGLSRQPVWLDQYHSAEIVEVNHNTADVPRADGSFTAERDLPLAILTADCLPIVLWSQNQVCVLHAGWRGLASGIIEAGLNEFNGVSAWIGPGIGLEDYEVDEAVKDHFSSSEAFQASRPGHYQFDLQREAERQLRHGGVRHVERFKASTASDERFYSHRAEGPTGRFATIAWLL